MILDIKELTLFALVLILIKIVWPQYFFYAVGLVVLAAIILFLTVIIGMALKDPRKELDEQFNDENDNKKINGYLIKLLGALVVFNATIPVNSKGAETDLINLDLTCYFKSMYHDPSDLYVTRNELQDSDIPKSFSIRAKRVGEPYNHGTSTSHQASAGEAIGKLSGQFDLLFYPEITLWQESEREYVFETRTINKRSHIVFIDRFAGTLNHYIGTHLPTESGLPDDLTYEYVNCRPQKPRF